MRRREFIRTMAGASLALGLPGCAGNGASAGTATVMTVLGAVDATDLGVTLAHEHLYADLRPHAEQAASPMAPDMDAVEQVVLPYLRDLRRLGCRSLVDCTATTLGREPRLIRQLSRQSGLHMLTVTGAYVAANGRFIPPYARVESEAQLAARWTGEWNDGIDGSGVRPGLIKLGIEGDPLTEIERKVLRAAARTHLATGLVIAAHTGPWADVEPGRNARCAFAQLDVLEEAGVAPTAWIWTHAQNEARGSHHVRAGQRGGWVSFDGFRPGQEDAYIAMLDRMREAALLDRVLVSQDAGWYNAGQPRGGEFKPYTPLFTALIPALRRHGFDEDEIATLLVRNPSRAFAIRTRRLEVPST